MLKVEKGLFCVRNPVFPFFEAFVIQNLVMQKSRNLLECESQQCRIREIGPIVNQGLLDSDIQRRNSTAASIYHCATYSSLE